MRALAEPCGCVVDIADKEDPLFAGARGARLTYCLMHKNAPATIEFVQMIASGDYHDEDYHDSGSNPSCKCAEDMAQAVLDLYRAILNGRTE